MRRIHLILLVGALLAAALFVFINFAYEYLPVRSCPEGGRAINCMPTSMDVFWMFNGGKSLSERRYCNPDNRKWVRENCPDAMYAD